MRHRVARAWLVAGLVVVAVSVIGLAAAVGNMVSLQYTPSKLLLQLRDSQAGRLAAKGLPDELVAHVRAGDDIPQRLRAGLSEEQLRDVDWFLQEILPSIAEAIDLAAAESRKKSQIGIAAICRAPTIQSTTPVRSMSSVSTLRIAVA